MMKDKEKFRRGLVRLAPLLDKLNRSRIVWLNQYPALDFVFDNRETGRNPEVGTDKLRHFNDLARSVLGSMAPGVRVWDSAEPLVEEYVRGCYGHRRTVADHHLNTWIECDDYIHVGHSVLSQMSQLLVNDLCNGILDDV